MIINSLDKQEFFSVYAFSTNGNQSYITVQINEKAADPGSVYRDAYNQILEIVTEENLSIVLDKVFGSLEFNNEVMKIRKSLLEDFKIKIEPGLTYVEGNPYWGKGIAGIQVIALSIEKEENIWQLSDGETVCGMGWRKDGARYLMLQNIGAKNYSNDENKREMQSSEMFERANLILKNNSAGYNNVVRTWIYLEDILDWYKEFNQVRNRKYKEFGFIPNGNSSPNAEQIYLPASTGILGSNPNKGAAVMDLFAVIPDEGSKVKIDQTSGIKQKSPFWYGSAFSRAMCIREPELTTILLSGTASIDESGNTVYVDDVEKQIRKTMEVVDALIREEKASLKDLAMATVFIKNVEDYKIYQRTAIELGLDKLPTVCVIADVCRKELLFEIDATFVHEYYID